MSSPFLTNPNGLPFPFWWDFLWLGPVQIPPLPAAFGMTDRVTKTVYYPQVSADDKHITFSTAPPVGGNVPVKVYGAYDGPFVGQYSMRLGISNGHVVVDQFADMGPGPFVRCATATTVMAVFFAQALVKLDSYDHLAFQSAPTQGSLFDPTP